MNDQKPFFCVNSRADLKKWGNFSITKVLSQNSGLPVVVENDGIATACSEYKSGSGGWVQFINPLNARKHFVHTRIPLRENIHIVSKIRPNVGVISAGLFA
ncbi:MAG: hypothetical protein ACOY16_08675 [Chloroflexota bacterium]